MTAGKRLLILITVLVTCVSGYAQELTVSAAISLKEGLNDLKPLCEKQTGKTVLFNFASSGQLLAQIREGAPVDVFISAADTQIDQAAKEKLIDPATRQIVAMNRLVLIAPAAAQSPPAGFAELADSRIKSVSIGEPKTVPAGEYAMQVLKHLKLDEPLKDRLVFAANVRQVLDYVERGEVDAGIVYTTDATQAGDKVKVIARADVSWHDAIHYPAAVVAASKQHDAADAFIKYLASPAAQKILQRRGFAPPATQPAAEHAR